MKIEKQSLATRMLLLRTPSRSRNLRRSWTASTRLQLRIKSGLCLSFRYHRIRQASRYKKKSVFESREILNQRKRGGSHHHPRFLPTSRRILLKRARAGLLHCKVSRSKPRSKYDMGHVNHTQINGDNTGSLRNKGLMEDRTSGVPVECLARDCLPKPDLTHEVLRRDYHRTFQYSLRLRNPSMAIALPQSGSTRNLGQRRLRPGRALNPKEVKRC
jgi:hypothetical protein